MKFNPLHCWDCGTQVIFGKQGRYELASSCRQVRFILSDGSYCESPFCESCSSREWTSERVRAFESAVNLVHPTHQIHILSVHGPTVPQGPVLAILTPVDVVQLHKR